MLDEALDEAGIDRASAYLTNAVKHFKWHARGKRRIHQKPNAVGDRRVPALAGRRAGGHPPEALVCLGATAAQALLGLKFRVTPSRGRLLDSELGRRSLATVHPSSILACPAMRRRADGTAPCSSKTFVWPQRR